MPLGNIIRKELFVFIGLFLILSFGMHYMEWFDHPLLHLGSLSHSTIGIYHPFLLTLGVYVSIGIMRVFIIMIKKTKVLLSSRKRG